MVVADAADVLLLVSAAVLADVALVLEAPEAAARASLWTGGGEPELGHDTAAALGTDVKEAMMNTPVAIL